jgi:hypothetical protein
MIEGLVEIDASMLVMVVNIVQELGIMYLVSGHETYKTTSRTVTTTLGRLNDIHVRAGNVVCKMVFLVVDTNTYDLLLSLEFLMEIGAVVNVEKALYRLGMDLGLMWRCSFM